MDVCKENTLDLRGVACPMNFVKTKLFLDKLPIGVVIHVLLDAGEPTESVCSSFGAEGQKIVSKETIGEQHYCVSIEKVL